jgi:tight adherence protein B
MNLELALLVLGGSTVAVFLGFVILRFFVEVAARLRRPRETPLLADRLSEHLAAVSPARSVGDRLDRRFERMVNRSLMSLTPTQAAAALILLAVVVWTGVWMWQDSEILAMAAGIGAAVLLLGVFWLMHLRWRQMAQAQLPDLYHLLARSLRAGLTVDQSIALIGNQGPQPLAPEFKRCSEHLELGMTVPAALEMTAKRIHLADFDLLVSLVALHRDTGGNLSLLVDRLAASVRSRNHFRGHVVSVTAMSRITGACLALAPPLLLGVYWMVYPDYVSRLTQTTQGLAAMAIAIALEVVGVLWMNWLLRIEY